MSDSRSDVTAAPDLRSDIVPDGFDLDAARQCHSSTARTERPRCPACYKLSIVKRSPGIEGITTDGRAYRCDKCGHTFDEPAEVDRR